MSARFFAYIEAGGSTHTMVRKASVILIASLFAVACATTDPNDPNAKAKRGAGIGDNLRRYPNEQFDIEGHTDSTGSDEYNLSLSQRRADSVKNYLVDQGVETAQIFARGFGESQPKASNDTPEGRQLNRRVEIHIRTNLVA